MTMSIQLGVSRIRILRMIFVCILFISTSTTHYLILMFFFIFPSILQGQFLAILVLLTIQDDIIHSIQLFTIFTNRSDDKHKSLNAQNMSSIFMKSGSLRDVDFEKEGKSYWKYSTWHVMLPSFFKVSLLKLICYVLVTIILHEELFLHFV